MLLRHLKNQIMKHEGKCRFAGNWEWENLDPKREIGYVFALHMY